MGTSSTRRISLAGAQNWRCAYCGVCMELDRGHPASATIDHVAPKGAGGQGGTANCVAACYACNAVRGADFDAWTFWRLRRRLAEAGLWPGGTLPPEPVKRFLRTYIAFTRAKLVLRRMASGQAGVEAVPLIGELVETLNDGCTLTALEIVNLPRSRRDCRMRPPSRLTSALEERAEWRCLWRDADLADESAAPGLGLQPTTMA